MSVSDLVVIPWLVANESLRRASRAVRSGAVYKWRYSGSATSGVKYPVNSLWPAYAEQAAEYYAGSFQFAGLIVTTGGASPFSVTDANMDWQEELQSFSWLRHLSAANTSLANAQAIALILDWIEHWGRDFNTLAWRSDILSKRLISWISFLPGLAPEISPDQHSRIMRSVSRQCRFLSVNAPIVRDGYPRLHAMIALSYAAICLAGREKNIRPASHELDKELDRQILSDGGHISRNPYILVELLADLLPLRDTFVAAGVYPPTKLTSSLDRMTSALRFFSNGNEELGNFNGTKTVEPGLLKTILNNAGQTGRIQQSAPQSGYERLAHGNSVVLIDCGKPLSHNTADAATAGTLSFELSSGGTRFIGNCGTPDNGLGKYAPFARATAAHSTVTISDRSSSKFADSSFLHSLLPSAFIRGPDKIKVDRNRLNGFSGLIASHNGYQNEFGLIHTRHLQLAESGNELNGSDQLQMTRSPSRASRLAALRFHLPANITASFLSGGNAVLLAGSQNIAWIFTCIDAEIELEESIQFCGRDGPRKSEQIVIYCDIKENTEIRWHLEKSERKPAKRRRKSKQSSRDLLETLNDDHPHASDQPSP